MRNSKIAKPFLAISGIIGVYIGASLLLTPVAFETSAGIHLDAKDINLLSEIRSSGGTLLVAGTLITLGAFISEMTRIALVLSTLFYLSYGLSRTIAMVFDGVPGRLLSIVTVAEISVGLLGLFILTKYKTKQYEIA